MEKEKISIADLSLGRIFLNMENPRFEPVLSETSAIENLCRDEDVLPLAKDIVKNGLNPLERFAVVPVGGSKKTPSAQVYLVVEGNRRLCALKLLEDPALAPPKFRKRFENLADQWSGIGKLSCVVFRDISAARTWMDRLHSGPQGGIGRKEWNADQKERFRGDGKFKTALEVLDYAEENGLISKAERKRKLTTVQRFLDIVDFRKMLGVDNSGPDKFRISTSKEKFDRVLKRFLDDLVDKSNGLNSRANKAEIIEYTKKTSLSEGVEVEPAELKEVDEKPIASSRKRKPAPPKPKKRTRIEYEQEIYDKLVALNLGKLSSLYYSVTEIDLEHHTPLISVGVWSLFESLTSLNGRAEKTSFESFLSNQKLQEFGFGKGQALKSLVAAIHRIHESGNTTKHHKVAANFYGEQLINDMDTLRDVILKCIDEAISNKK